MTLLEALDQLGPIRRPEAALILPDACSRLTVLEFDNLPPKTDERESLIELQQLGAGDREASPVQDESTDYDASAKTSFSIGSQYTSKTSKR